jgi:hypothetical protein
MDQLIFSRAKLITTAMTTKSHHFLARTLSMRKQLLQAMSQNYVGEIQVITDTSHIKLEEIQEESIMSQNMRTICQKEEGNDLLN